MKTTFFSKGLSKSDALEAHIKQNLEKVANYFGDEAECKAVYRQEGRLRICELTIDRKGDIFRCESKHQDIYVAASNAVDNLWGKIRKYKSKIEKTRREKHEGKTELVNKSSEHASIPVETSMQNLMVADISSIKCKKITPNVMSVAEALDAIELIGHSFYIFTNVETDKPSILYKRDNEKYGEFSYGIIEIQE